MQDGHPWVIRSRVFFFLTATLWVQRKAPAGSLGPLGHIPPFLLQRGREDELGLGDEDLEPREEPFGASEMA